MSIDRRTFLAGSVSALAAARLSAAKNPHSRQLVDVCNGRVLGGVRIRARNLTTGTQTNLRTSADGSWDYAALLESIQDPDGEMVEVLIRPDLLGDIPYAGLRVNALLRPTNAGGRDNRRALRLSLVPLAKPFGITVAPDTELDEAWPALIAETLFGDDRRPEEVTEKLSFGAARSWQTRKITLLFGESLKETELNFLLAVVPDAVKQLTAGAARTEDGGIWPADQLPGLADDVPPGAILFVANDDFPRPSVISRYDTENHHRVDAARITLDNLTLRNFFREGEGNPEELAMARHLVQRCIANALGYSATMALPNRTLLDASPQASGVISRTGIRPEDTLLARVLYGSGWLVPGARMNADKDEIINGSMS